MWKLQIIENNKEKNRLEVGTVESRSFAKPEILGISIKGISPDAGFA